MNDIEINLDEELAKLEELERLTKTLYIPHPKQKQFHCALNTVRAAFGGNRTGKSECGINEVRMHTTGRYPDWYPEAKRWAVPTRGRIIVKDFKNHGDVIEKKIDRWFDPETIVRKERSVGNLTRVFIQHISGGVSTFDIMTHEQDSLQFEGWNGHWVWFDEPPPRDKYIACLRGLVDFEGRAWITATPLSEPWLFDEIMNNEKQDCWHIAISIYDNPYLTQEGINILLGSITEEEMEARIYGKFLHLSGRVYKELDTNVHLIDEMPNGSHSWPVYFVLDPADRRPHHGIWAKIDPFGTIYVFDELVYKGTIKDTSKEILIRERMNHIKSLDAIRVLDPNKGRVPSLATGLKLVDEFASHAVYFSANVNDDVALGHLAVKERLSYDSRQPVSTTNHPKIYFVRSKTRECVKQLLSYVWDDWKGNSASSKSEKETPKDINKDMPDCIRYLCMSNPTFFEQENHGYQLPERAGYTGWGA